MGARGAALLAELENPLASHQYQPQPREWASAAPHPTTEGWDARGALGRLQKLAMGMTGGGHREEEATSVPQPAATVQAPLPTRADRLHAPTSVSAPHDAARGLSKNGRQNIADLFVS